MQGEIYGLLRASFYHGAKIRNSAVLPLDEATSSVFERYSMIGGNRLSLTLTLFQNGDSPIRLSAITAGGSQAVFFKVNTLGEESFLDDVKDLLEEILEE